MARFLYVFKSKCCVFQVLTAASMKMTRAFWDTVPCSVVEVYRRFRGAYCLHHHGDHRKYDGGSMHLWNVDLLLRHYTAQYPTRLSSSKSCNLCLFQNLKHVPLSPARAYMSRTDRRGRVVNTLVSYLADTGFKSHLGDQLS
jgi:hypothetical protein